MLLDLLFPQRSLSGTEGRWITPEELLMIQSATPVVTNTAELRSSGLHFLDCAVACSDFRKAPLLRKAIHLLKYKRIAVLAETLGKLLAVALPLLPLPKNEERITSQRATRPSVLVPLPLHWTRHFSRGFNQSMLLATAVHARTGIPILPMLRRTHATGSQVGRNRSERLQKMTGAFAAKSQKELPTVAILIDDVMTTGSTVNAAAGALKAAGIAHVFALTLAKE